MDLELAGLLIDAGLCVLAWMVQLIVYPGFLVYDPSNLLKWHRKYTPRITGIVAPLMIAQLILSTFKLVREPDGLNITSFILILSIWLITFLLFVPLHQKIDRGLAKKVDLGKLVGLSWYRTIPWSLVLLLNLISN